MQSPPPTIIYRHKRENLKKCSLRGLESRSDFKFYTYPKDILPPLKQTLILDLNAPPLTKEDKDYSLLIVDGTWRYAEVMLRQIERQIKNLPRRSIPSHYRTAYPRKQEDCPNPEIGLASVEAIYIAFSILGRDTEGLLDFYYWKEEFLKQF